MTPHPHPHPHPWRPVHQRRTTHAIAVHRPNRPRCRYPDPCDCANCRNRWLLVLGGAEGERWAARVQREPAARMTEALGVACRLVIASWLAWQAYIIVTTGGIQS